MFEQMKEAGKQAIKQGARKLWKKLLPLLLKYIVLPLAIIILIVTLIYGLYALLTGQFSKSKEESSEVYTLDSSNGYVAKVSDELIDNIRENLKNQAVDMEFLGKDEAEQNETIETFVMAEIKSSYPYIKKSFWTESNHGGIKFVKASNNEQLDFEEPEAFHEKVENNNTEALGEFTIEGNTFYYADESYVEKDGVRTTTLTERSGNYKNMVSGYGMPYEFFVNVAVHTEQLQFALDLANYVIDNSEVTISIMDTTTVTVTTTTTNYDWYYQGYKRYTFNFNASGNGAIDQWHEEWTEGINQDGNSTTDYNYNVFGGNIYRSINLADFTKEELLDDYEKEYGADDFYNRASSTPSVGVEEILRQMAQKAGEANSIEAPSRTDVETEPGEDVEVVTKGDTTSYTRVTEVKSWIGDVVTGFNLEEGTPSLTYGENGQDTNLPDSDWEKVEDNEGTSNSDDYRKQRAKQYEEQYRVFCSGADVSSDTGLVSGDIKRKKTNTVQNVYEEVTTPVYVLDPEKVENEDEKVEGVLQYFRTTYEDTFTGIKNEAGELLVDSAEMWFDELEQNENTKNLANVMRYLLYKYSGNDYGVTDLSSLLLDWLQNASSITATSSGYWWPIGGQEITEENGVKYAKGAPTATTISAGMIYPSGGYHGAMDISGDGRSNYHNVISATHGRVTAVYDGVADGTGESYGNYIKILSSDGNTIIYAHLYEGSIQVSLNDEVKQGQLLAKMGNSGNSTGTHLHFEIRDSAGNQVDPQNYVSASNPRPTGGALIEFLKRFEGSGTLRNGKYIVEDDGIGVPTVGPGINISANAAKFRARGIDPDSINHIGAEVDKQIVDDIFNETVNQHATSVNQTVAGLNLTQYQKDALTSLHFNLGNINGFVDAYNEYGAAEPLYTNYFRNRGHTELTGIKRRRRAEYVLFTTGDYSAKGNDYY